MGAVTVYTTTRLDMSGWWTKAIAEFNRRSGAIAAPTHLIPNPNRPDTRHLPVWIAKDPKCK